MEFHNIPNANNKLEGQGKEETHYPSEHSPLLEKCKEINHASDTEEQDGDLRNKHYFCEMENLSYRPQEASYQYQKVGK